MLWGAARPDVKTYKPILPYDLYDWQEHVLAAGTAKDADGQYLARYVGVSVARQNGKTTILDERAIRAVLSGERVISTSRDLGKAHKRWLAGLKLHSDRPRRQVGRQVKGQGQCFF